MAWAIGLVYLPVVALGAKTPTITVTGSEQRPTDFALRKRVYVPYMNGAGYAFGMGAAEQAAYDPVNKYAYAISEQGYINIVDWSSVDSAEVKPAFTVSLAGQKLTDVELCVSKKLLIVGSGASDTVSNGNVRFYSLVERASPARPTLLHTETVGALPDMVLPNSDCSKVAVANEGEGKVVNGFLVDPEGSVDILTLTGTGSTLAVSKASVSLNSHTDAQLIAKGVHLPLSLDAQTYWDTTYGSFSCVNFTNSRAAYTPATQLEPEYLSWSSDDTKLYVNLQENNAIATISVPSSGAPSVAFIDALGLKDHGSSPIDIKQDSTTGQPSGTPATVCTQKTYSGFKALRHPDAIQTVVVNGVTHVLTANEGDDKDYGCYEEKQKLNDVTGSDGALKSGWTGMTISAAAKSTAAAVYADASKMRITIGSSAIDFSNASAPVFQQVVAIGGRGISVYRDTGSGLSLVWDSQGDVEAQVCSNYPSSHNAIQDEEFSPMTGSGNDLYMSSGSSLKGTIQELNDPSQDGCNDGGDGNAGACPLGRTIDERSPKDGAGVEAIVAGNACGSLIAVTATEKSSVALIYDITTPTSPHLLFVKHLSPISETQNPGVAYANRTLGDIDPESMIFLEAGDSPTGNAGVMFAGAWSGTLSFWEFTCPAANNNNVSGAMSMRTASLVLPLVVAALGWIRGPGFPAA